MSDIALHMRSAKASSTWALLILFSANVFNVLDRALLSVALQPIKVDLSLSDVELSLIVGPLFFLVYITSGLTIARLVDTSNRVLILFIGITVWSLATAATALAEGFYTLALARVLVGIGEATALPVAMSLIPDLFALRSRGKAISVFQTSGFIGVSGGTIVAGAIASEYGWRSMFASCGLAGLLVSLVLILTVREPVRLAGERSAGPNVGFLRDTSVRIAGLWRTPGFGGMTLGFGVAAMLVAILTAWAPALLQRSYGASLIDVGLIVGPATAIGGLSGTLVAGVMTDRVVRHKGMDRCVLYMPIVALPLSTPFALGFLYQPHVTVGAICLGMTCFASSFAVTPVMNFAVSRARPDERGLTSMMLLIAAGLIGGSIGPTLVGYASDTLAPTWGPESLRYALVSLSGVPLLASALFTVALRRTPTEDQQRGSTGITQPVAS